MKYQKDLTKNSFMTNRTTKTETMLGTFYLKIQSHQSLRNLKQSLEVYSIILIFVQKVWISSVNDKKSEGFPMKIHNLKKRRHQIKLKSVCKVHQKK